MQLVVQAEDLLLGDALDGMMTVADAEKVSIGRGRGKKPRRLRAGGKFVMRYDKKVAGGAGEEEEAVERHLSDLGEDLEQVPQALFI